MWEIGLFVILGFAMAPWLPDQLWQRLCIYDNGGFIKADSQAEAKRLLSVMQRARME